MPTTSICFIGQDGTAPSGVTSYGFSLLAAYPEARMLLLNASENPPAAPRSVQDRVVRMAETESHNVMAVARRLREMFDPLPDRLIVLPNTGDTSWSATVECLRALSPKDREHVRVLGIVHSDADAQYSGAVNHANFASAWIGVSQRCAQELRRRLAGVPRCVHELPYPITLPGKSTGPTLSEPLHLVFVGRLEEPQKCVSRLAALFARLVARKIDFQATIAGDGPARRALTAAVTSGGAVERVEIVGSLDHNGVGRLLNGSDVFLLTSAYEGLPLALLEAMAAGLCPVVMAVESGLPELLEDGVNGRVVPQGDVAGMVEVIAELADDRAQVARLGAAARRTVAARFSPEAHFRRLAAIIDELWVTTAPDPAAVAVDPTAAAVADIAAQLKAIGKPAAVFGAGMFGRKLVDACANAGLALCGLFDSDPARWGWSYRGLPCWAPEELLSIGDAVVAIGSLQFAPEMREQVVREFLKAGSKAPMIISASA